MNEIKYLFFDNEFCNVYCIVVSGIIYINENYKGADKTILLC